MIICWTDKRSTWVQSRKLPKMIHFQFTFRIVTDTQLPEGHETVKKIIDMEEWMEAQRKAQFEFEETEEPGIPLFPVPLSPVTIPDMDSAKFICKVKAFPTAKVHWFINGKMVVNSARYRITYDGMMHQLEIPQVQNMSIKRYVNECQKRQRKDQKSGLLIHSTGLANTIKT